MPFGKAVESMQISKKLWDFYLSEENTKYLRQVGGTVSLEAAKVSEMPWKVYTKDVLKSVEDYSDAAIVTLSRVITGGGGKSTTCSFSETIFDTFSNKGFLK